MGAAPILTISKNGQELKTQPVNGEVVLGRAEGCVIRLDDRAVSREHAVFRPAQGGVQVERMSEVAPLSVNGNECTRAIIKEGDVIEIGPYLLKLSSSSAQTNSEAPSIPTPISMALSAPSLDVSPTQSSVSTTDPANSLELTVPSSSGNLTTGDLPSLESSPSTGMALEIETPEIAPPPEVQTGSGPQIALEEPSAPTGMADLGAVQIDEEAKTKVLPAGKLSAKLMLPAGVANVTEFEVDKDEISIGRGQDCDIVLDDKKASRKHAVIRRTGVTFSVKDLGSANGTFLNGAKIEEKELTGDDILKIGSVEFRFLALSADYAAKQNNFMPVQEEAIPDFQMGLSDAGQAASPDEVAVSSSAIHESGAPNGYYSAPAAPIPGMASIPGMAGLPAKKSSLFQKYRALPPRRKAIWTAVIIAGVFFLLFDEPEKAPPKKPATIVKKGEKPSPTFDSLTPEQKKFVESQHALAFDYYKNRDYDKALFEIQKIFTLIPDYKDSREIERYAKEGKRKLEALEEEKRKKEEEEKLKLRIADLVGQTKMLMDQKKYPEAKEMLPQILALDPDNAQVSEWRKVLDQIEEDLRIAEQQKQVQEQINLRAWDLYKEGLGQKKQKHYQGALETFKKVFDLGASDKKVEKSAGSQIKQIERILRELRDPVLAEAKQSEESQEFLKAFNLYKKATEIDPQHPAGYAGMNRIRGILHEKAKVLYIDAVLAESYSDFETAKKKYLECREVAPWDDIYRERADRKLATFFKPKEEQPQ